MNFNERLNLLKTKKTQLETLYREAGRKFETAMEEKRACLQEGESVWDSDLLQLSLRCRRLFDSLESIDKTIRESHTAV